MNVFTEQKPKRSDQKAATRARILEVARAELERSGYEATNIRGIANAAGVSTGAVLLHFQDKQDLLHAALFGDLERTWQAVHPKLGRKSIEADLATLARTFFAFYKARPALSRALLRESLFAAPPWSNRFASQVGDVHSVVAALAAAAIKRGEMKSDVDTALFGAAFFSFYYFALLAWLQGGHPDPLRLFRRLLNQHINGLRK